MIKSLLLNFMVGFVRNWTNKSNFFFLSHYKLDVTRLETFYEKVAFFSSLEYNSYSNKRKGNDLNEIHSKNNRRKYLRKENNRY